ncbi:hypothetical protein AVEN_18430-1 [Araneus ventricosus]|uniref:Secreted protein n=1 Tax=Araneus ventricosus TaxID=182803 RepID=A0A4Y2G6C8_ARAVE|nr:hypothetical protein AVEN_18430-1 [Araneus ventricosus]
MEKLMKLWSSGLFIFLHFQKALKQCGKQEVDSKPKSSLRHLVTYVPRFCRYHCETTLEMHDPGVKSKEIAAPTVTEGCGQRGNPDGHQQPLREH